MAKNFDNHIHPILTLRTSTCQKFQNGGYIMQSVLNQSGFHIAKQILWHAFPEAMNIKFYIILYYIIYHLRRQPEV